jgi:hypothetical protein
MYFYLYKNRSDVPSEICNPTYFALATYSSLPAELLQLLVSQSAKFSPFVVYPIIPKNFGCFQYDGILYFTNSTMPGFIVTSPPFRTASVKTKGGKQNLPQTAVTESTVTSKHVSFVEENPTLSQNFLITCQGDEFRKQPVSYEQFCKARGVPQMFSSMSEYKKEYQQYCKSFQASQEKARSYSRIEALENKLSEIELKFSTSDERTRFLENKVQQLEIEVQKLSQEAKTSHDQSQSAKSAISSNETSASEFETSIQWLFDLHQEVMSEDCNYIDCAERFLLNVQPHSVEQFNQIAEFAKYYRDLCSSKLINEGVFLRFYLRRIVPKYCQYNVEHMRVLQKKADERESHVL